VKEKKNIDRLFQEKFKDFEAQPGAHVWESIAAREKQKRKRVIPLWIKLGGVAAVIALLLLAGNFVFDTQNTVSPKLVQEKQSEDTNASNGSTNPQTEVASEETPNQQTEDKSDTSDQFDTVATEEIKTEQKDNAGLNSYASRESQFANVTEQKTNDTKESQPTANSTKTEAVALSQSEKNKLRNTTDVQNSSGSSDSDSLDAGLQTETITTQNAVAKEEESKEPETETDPDELLRIANREEEIADATTEDPETQKSNRWGITPLVAPVYYGDFGGSGIDPQFADNAKRGDVNLSYGLQVSYALNDKLKLRAGVNRVDLGYRTEQVAFTPSIQASSLRSIDYNKSASQVQVSTFSNRMNTMNSIPNAPVSEEFASSNFASPSSTLRQQLGYIEVPLEAEYALVDKKFGMQIIGGFSTLFLNDNSVILEEGSRFTTELGSSNSLNNTSFSTNIGIGFDYRITPAIEFNLEPIFKYQLNAYTNGVSDFKPYYMGLYTGINVRF
tara:strand:- start:48277 stop:49779 length:1503 start_codon:yes stop_codon:yes gene_type:complete